MSDYLPPTENVLEDLLREPILSSQDVDENTQRNVIPLSLGKRKNVVKEYFIGTKCT